MTNNYRPRLGNCTMERWCLQPLGEACAVPAQKQAGVRQAVLRQTHAHTHTDRDTDTHRHTQTHIDT
eukprot:6473400-Pyramimonas_sp.AAC.1